MKQYTIEIDSYIGYPITKQWVAAQLKATDGKPCTVRINSYGGDVQTALDIRQQFIDHGKVTACIFGMTASAATILAMGAKKIQMSRYALMLIHRCASYAEAWGNMNAEEIAAAIRALENTKTDLETIDGLIVALYAERTGTKPADIAHVMQEGAWLTADRCLELGLIDEIIEEGEAEPLTDATRHQFAACGLPLPDQATPPTTTHTPQPSPRSSLLQRLGLKKKENNKNPHIMEETRPTAEQPTAEQPTAEQPTAEQPRDLETLEAKAQELRTRVDALEEENKALRAQVATLRAADGASDSEVTPETDPAAPAAPTAAAMYDRIKKQLA